MSPVLAVVFGCVLLAAWLALTARRALSRRRRDELRSTSAYRTRLDTLHVAPKDRGGSVRLVDTEPSPGSSGAPERPRLESVPSRLGAAPDRAEREPDRRHGRRWALSRSEPRARIDTATMLVVAAVAAAIVALGLVGLLIEHDRDATTPRSLSAPTRPYVAAPSRSSTNAQIIARSLHAS